MPPLLTALLPHPHRAAAVFTSRIRAAVTASASFSPTVPVRRRSTLLGQLAAVWRPSVRSLAMSTTASDNSSEHVRADNTALFSSSSSSPASSVPSPPSVPPSSFLWIGYRSPYPSTPPSPLPNYYNLSSWPADPLRAFVWWYGEAESYYATLLRDTSSSSNSNNSSSDSSSSVGSWQAVNWPNNMQLATADSTGQPHVRNVLLKGVDCRGLIFFTNREGGKGRQLAANSRAAVVFYWKGLERQVRVEGEVEEVSEAESDGYFHSRAVGSQVSAAVSPQSRPIGNRAALEEHYVDQISRLTRAAANCSTTAGHMPPHSLDIAQLPSTHSHPHSDSPAFTSAFDAHSQHQHALASLASIERQLRESGTGGALQHFIRRPSNWGGYRIIPRLFEFWEDGQYRLHSRIEYNRRPSTSDSSSSSSGQQPLSTAHSEWEKRFLAP